MRGRANPKKINHHQLAVMFPPGFQEARLGMPTHRKSGTAIEHPGPVDALIDFCREVLDFLIGEILARREDAAQENRGINGGEFALLPALTGFHVNEMKEEAVLVVQIVGDEFKRVSNAIGNLRRLAVAAVDADAKTGQAEPC